MVCTSIKGTYGGIKYRALISFCPFFPSYVLSLEAIHPPNKFRKNRYIYIPTSVVSYFGVWDKVVGEQVGPTQI